MSPCPFCEADREPLIEAALALALPDAFPVSPGHTLVVPRRHVTSYFGCTSDERLALWQLVDDVRKLLEAKHEPAGFNVGINIGQAAGQTVFHCHIHVIPRYEGDVPDPRGGVRGVIPSHQKPGGLRAEQETPRTAPTGHGPFDDLPSFVGGDDQHLFPVLSDAIGRADKIDIVSAFVQPSGFALLRDRLRDALARGARVRLLTGDYMNITSPDALREVLALMAEQPAFSAWVYACGDDESFHPKSYIFSRGDDGIAFVGSSNISKSALQNGVEWNMRTVVNAPVFRTVRDRFEHLLRASNTHPLTREWIDSYSERARVPPSPEPRLPPPRPNEIQKEALAALIQTRAHGARRGLVVMATGLGKTYLAAFDAKAVRAGRALFVAHRDEILTQARDAWARIFPDKVVGILGGGKRERDADILFASIQTLARAEHLRGFATDHFDYIVTDEFHHAAASSYRKVLAHFQPKFMLGLTATPDRMDGASLLALCDDNLVYRKDLVGGIAAKLLVPFHYFGVKDAIDFTPIPWRSGKFDVEELTKAVATEERAEQALASYREHATATPLRTLCFCVSVVHADFMAAFFRRRGLQAVAVHSGPSSAPRADSLARLVAGELEVICAVDIFNEGLDLPNINTVLMLRPTESPVIFLQQIGRGLRQADNKSHLTIVDFIGNHRSFLQKPQALLSLLGHSLSAFPALKRIREHSLELPEGCTVDIELDALDMLERLCRPGSDDLLVFKYVELRDAHGRRPTASELHAAQLNLSPIRDRDGTWFDFIGRQGDLTTDEQRVLQRHREWFRDVQATRMTKCYKMIALRALLDLDRLREGCSLDEIAAASRRALRAHVLLASERDEDDIEDPEAFARAWRTFPLGIWANGEGTSQPWFKLSDEGFIPRFKVDPEDADTFDLMTEEIVELRLREHESRLKGKSTSKYAPIVLRVSHASGRPILRFDRERQPAVPEGPTRVRVDGHWYTFDFVKIAVNKAVGEDASVNVLPVLMRAWFGPRAGHPGSRHEAELSHESGEWTLKKSGEDEALAEVIPFPSLPFYEDLQVACGDFPGDSDAQPKATPIHVRTAATVDPRLHFVVRASGDSMDGGATPIQDGDLVLCEWLRAATAGQVEGHIVLVQGPEGAALKSPRRRNGGWVLESANSKYAPLTVPDGTSVQPLAKFVQIVEEASGLILWGEYDRAQIASAFGGSYNRAWEVGHYDVPGKPHTLLLVTLRKDDQPQERYRYEDRFVSPTEFQWESQDSTAAGSKKGRSITQHSRDGRTIHLFVRYKGKQAFTYCGPVHYMRHESEKPMRVWYRLDRPLPEGLWRAWAP